VHLCFILQQAVLTFTLLVALFIMGTGFAAANLQTASNPYVVVIGPREVPRQESVFRNCKQTLHLVCGANYITALVFYLI